ncbi:MAG TPA: mannosyltransferase family protein [Roseiflexaceae bacterium]|nr:mannosyltransferase family protein [Roseiflexaceae bacterium]
MQATAPTVESTIGRGRIDLRKIKDAALVVALLRVVLGLWALPISALYPDNQLETQIGLLPGDASVGQWIQRVLVMPWVRYDVRWYYQIAEHGYRPGEGTAAFHPLYPLLARLVAPLLGGNIYLSLLLVSTCACVALCVVFTRYVEDIHGEQFAQPSGWLLLLGPLGFILLIPYNESLFLALAVGTLWATARDRWWIAGLLGCLAALTRQQGLALALPLSWALLQALRERRARISDIGALLLVPCGYGLFLLYRAIALGDLNMLAQSRDPADFLRGLLVSRSSEIVLGGQRIAWPWEPLFDQLRLIFTKPDTYDLAIDLILGWAGVLVLVFGWRRMPTHERLYSFAIVILTLCYYNGYRSPALSLPRHMLLAFPIFIVLARWAGGGRKLRLTIEVFALMNLFLAGAYVRHGWIP